MISFFFLLEPEDLLRRPRHPHRFFVNKKIKAHDLTNLGALCTAIKTKQPRCAVPCCRFVKHKHFPAHTVSIYLFSLRTYSCLACDRSEPRGASVLSFAAVSTVRGFVPKLHGAPTKCHQVTTVVVCVFFLFLFLFLIIAGMLFEACDKHVAHSTHTHTHTHFGKLSLSQHVLINLLRAICQEIFSFKQPRANRDEALFLRGRALQGLTNSCLYASQSVNKDYVSALLSLQTHRPVTHLNG